MVLSDDVDKRGTVREREREGERGGEKKKEKTVNTFPTDASDRH